MADYAYTKYSVETYPDGSAVVYCETNDDGDTGYPGEFATWRLDYDDPNGKEMALKHTGVSRQGIGHRVFVTLDGEEI